MPKLGHKSLELQEFYDVIFMADKGMEHEKKSVVDFLIDVL